MYRSDALILARKVHQVKLGNASLSKHLCRCDVYINCHNRHVIVKNSGFVFKVKSRMLGHFDPKNVIFNDNNNELWGDLPDVSVCKNTDQEKNCFLM